MGPKGAGRALRLALSLLFVPAGCALVIDASSELGDECSFDGSDDNLCGVCLALECQEAINGCCGDPGCQETMGLVDECATGDELACAEMENEPAAEPIVRCLAEHCEELCGVYFTDLPEGGGGGGAGGEGEGGGASSDGSSCSMYEDFCLCSYSGPGSGNDVVCNETLFGGSACCAGFRYPEEDSCSCEEVGCELNVTFDSCTCRTGVLDPSTPTSCGGGYSYCCQTFNECRCSNDIPCDFNEVEVSTCSAATIPCPTGLSVESCSF